MLFQVLSIQPSERWMCAIRNSSIWPLKGSAMPLTSAQACSATEVLGRDPDRALDQPDQVRGACRGPIMRRLAETKGHSTLPHQEGDRARAGRGGVEGGALPMSAGTSWPPTNRPARVAQPSDEGVAEADAGWASRGPRFARFAAVMEADPASQDQLFPRSQRRIRTADPAISSPRIRWLGIGSWALFCAALFVSLLLRPDRVSFQLDQIQPRTVVSDVRPMADSMPTTTRFLPAHGQGGGRDGTRNSA